MTDAPAKGPDATFSPDLCRLTGPYEANLKGTALSECKLFQWALGLGPPFGGVLLKNGLS